MARIRLGDMLVKAGLIDELQLQSALAYQRQWGGRLGDILVNNGFLDEMMLWRGLSKQLGVPLVSLPEQKMAPGIENQIPHDLCLKNSIFPIHRDDKGLTVATSDPGNIGGLDDLAFRLGFRLRTVLAPDREVEWAIRRYHQGDPAPCPPPRLRRQVGNDESVPGPPDVAMQVEQPFVESRTGTPSAQLAELQAQQQAQLLAQQQQQQLYAQQQAQLLAQQQALLQAQQHAAWQQQQMQQMQQQMTGAFPAPQQMQQQLTGSWTSPQTAPTDAELMMRETAHLLRFLVEACVQRGVFSRDDYLSKLRSL